jgi:serine protease Do
VALLAFALTAFCSCRPVGAQTETKSKAEQKKPDYSRKSEQFANVFAPVADLMKEATVRVKADEEQVSLGTLIDDEGFILTKASELKRNLSCEVGGETFPATVIGIHPETDLALLKIQTDSDALNPIVWSTESGINLGKWVVSPKANPDDHAAIGVISTGNLRQIKPSRPFIGIEMKDAKAGIRITKVVNKSPADYSGLLVGDVIYQLDDQPIKNRIELFKALGQYDADDRVTIKVMRFEKEVDIRLTLAEADKLAPSSQRSNQQNSMGSRLSRRRKDFPNAIQHDSMLQSDTCGGPLLDLSGNAVGINIARAGRVASYALPVEVVLPIVKELKTGKLAPAVVNKAKIEVVEMDLKKLKERLATLPEKQSVLNIRVNSEIARKQELKASITELENLLTDRKKRLADIEGRSGGIRKELNSIRKKLRSDRKSVTRLEEQLERLKTGSSR